MVLSHIWKYMSGWSNYSGIVTSHMIRENIMGNRGSKSAILKNIVVKERRVDGSWYGINLPYLRCYYNGFRKKLSEQNPYYSIS